MTRQNPLHREIVRVLPEVSLLAQPRERPEGGPTHHVGSQFCSHASWDVPNLSTHHVVHTDGIAIVLIIGLPFKNNMLTQSGHSSVEANSYDLSIDLAYPL